MTNLSILDLNSADADLFMLMTDISEHDLSINGGSCIFRYRIPEPALQAIQSGRISAADFFCPVPPPATGIRTVESLENSFAFDFFRATATRLPLLW